MDSSALQLSSVVLFPPLSMAKKNAAGSSKRKHVFCETGLDSDSGEEKEIDIGIVAHSHGHGTTSRHLHVNHSSSKCAKSIPTSVIQDKHTPDVPPPKEKRKQVHAATS